MTRVFRAEARNVPRVLRLGVVRGGRVVEERLVPRGTAVTVGTDETCLVVLSGADAPSRQALFSPTRDGYSLHVTAGMDGRVILSSQIVVLSSLRAAGTTVPLSGDSRGRIVVGDTSFLFQFVEPPPVTPRAALPLAVVRGGIGIDFKTTLIAALSFLAHFFLIGAAYSDFLDEVVDDDIRSLAVLDSLPPVAPPPVEVPDEIAPTERTAVTKTTTPEEAQKVPSGHAGNPAHDRASTSAQASLALSNALTTVMQTVGVLQREGSATAGVLTNGEVPTGALDVAAHANTGVGFELSLLSGADHVRPGATSTLAQLGDTHGKAAPGEGKGHGPESGPRGSVDTSRIDNVGGRVTDAARVVASLRGGFRACYNRALAQNPDVAGRISLALRVGAGGRVEGVTASPSGAVPESLVACVRAKAAAAEFSPPEGGAAMVNVPVSFVKQP